MILPSDKYSLLLLADWLEEYGSPYDIVKAAAIRNNKYTLNYKNNCKDIYHGTEHSFGWGGGIGGSVDGHGFGDKYSR